MILEYLSRRPGETSEIRSIANGIGISQASVKVTLTDMAIRGRVRGGSINGKAAYFIPTAEQLEREELARQNMPAWRPEHRISQAKREIYERINAERLAIPSIG
jgi:hypothetical protein